MHFRGSYVALLTPFTGRDEVNVEKLREMVEFQIENGTDGLVPCGTTGESPTLSWEEHKLVVRTVVEAARKRVQVIAGAGSNNTREAVEATRFAREVGADAALIVNPYYNKPTQEGLYQHFKAIAEQGGLPIVIYNILGRTAINVETSTLVRLKGVANIQGIKEASGNLNQISDVIRLCGDAMDVLSGDDSLTLPLLSVGGTGVVSVAANIVPREVKALCESWFMGDAKAALAMHRKLFPLCQALFLETNPIPVREAMNLLDWKTGAARLPLTPLSEKNRALLEVEMKAFGLKVKG
ncbi:MAG: 4-hydroxy-tetrahydrodipicolinate synthase [Fibrobacterota bacterium]